MTVMYQVVVNWSGFQGAPGFTNLFATTTDPLQAGADTFGGGVNTLITTWANALPGPQVKVQVDPAVKLIEDTTGDLVDVLNLTTPPAAHIGLLGGNFSAASGFCIDWLTSTVVFAHRPMGRSFVVPCSTEAYQNDGTIVDATIAAQRTAAGVYAAATTFHPVVWVRPRKADSTKVPPVTARAGASVAISAARIVDKVAILRSRRD